MTRKDNKWYFVTSNQPKFVQNINIKILFTVKKKKRKKISVKIPTIHSYIRIVEIFTENQMNVERVYPNVLKP